MAHPRPAIMQPKDMAEYNEHAASNNVLDTASTGPKQQYQRTYQACLPCRKRKVKCDLGSPENPHDPPCARCRREQKPCAFSLTRRKRKSSTLSSESDDEDPPVHLQRKRSARGELLPVADYNGSPSLYREASDPRSVSQVVVTSVDGTAHPASHGQNNAIQDEEVHNPTAVDVFGPQHVTGPTNAMQTLIHAAGLLKNQSGQDHDGKIDRSLQFSGARTSSQGLRPSRHGQSVNGRRGGYSSGSPTLDPAITTSNYAMPEPSQQTLRVWSRLRFVRAGWFTAKEAAQYIEYYYTHLAPLTLVTHPDFRQIENDPDLLVQEPMLAVTLLTISSRYMRVTGRGSDTRSLMIHDRLWHYLQSTVTRMFWGQEQSGGGFCGAGARKATSDTANLVESSKLRSLGSIESLLLLSDFHPRSIHFPPSDDDGELIITDEVDPDVNGSNEDEVHRDQVTDYLKMFEPIARSEKMSWSLICFAHTLAYELGVFGTYANGKTEDGGRIKSTGTPSLHEQRMDRIDRLLYIYMTQASGRFGFPGIYPKQLADQYMEEVQRNFRTDPTTLNLTPSDLNLYYCTELTSLNKLCNEVLFQSHQATEKLIETGEVVTILSDLVPRLEAWKRRLDNAPVDEDTKTLLSIEVNYFLVYVNGQGLQAWWDHFRSTYSNRHQNGDYQSPSSSVSSHLSNLTDQHEKYIIGCVNACREILQHVVVNLGKNSKLRHAPVRTISSITSAAMFLCKTFLRGNLRSSVNESTRLLDETIKALRASVVDDVHLSLQWADILELINKRLSSNFITLAPPTDSSPSQASFPLSQSSSPPVKEHNIHKPYHKRKPRAGSFTTRPHPNHPDVNVVMPPPSRSMYHHQQQQANTWPSVTSNNNGDLDNATTNNAINITDNNSSNDFTTTYPSYPPLYPNNNNSTNTTDNQSFNFTSNDEPWVGVPLDQVVNAPPSYLIGSNPTNFDFANPFRLESGSSLSDLLSLLGDDFTQGSGEGGY